MPEEEAMAFVRALSWQQQSEFRRQLSDVGATLESWVEAIQYSGDPIETHFALYLKRNLFSKHLLAVGVDAQALSTMMHYIEHHPDYNRRRLCVTKSAFVVRSGDSMIVSRLGFKGGKRDDIANIVRRWGGGENDISYVCEEREDTLLGYTPLNAYLSATDLVEIVAVAYVTPCSRSEQEALIRQIVRVARKLQMREKPPPP